MNKKEFEKLFSQITLELRPTADELSQKLSEYTGSNSSIDPTQLASALYVESISYTNQLVYRLLSAVLTDDD